MRVNDGIEVQKLMVEEYGGGERPGEDDQFSSIEEGLVSPRDEDIQNVVSVIQGE